LTNSAHNIANIRATREALKWVFDEAEVGDVSPLYECGNNDRLLLVALTGINKAGYRSAEKMTEVLKEELMTEKKIDKIYESAKNVKNIEEAKSVQDVIIDTVKHVSFSAPTFIAATTTSEPAIGAAAYKTAKDEFAGPIKGKNGVYMFQTLNKTKTSEQYDAKSEQNAAAMNNYRYVSNAIINTLYLKANVKDSRYKFF
jgi:peptidyl-prolyl cis-trans isomerase D